MLSPTKFTERKEYNDYSSSRGNFFITEYDKIMNPTVKLLKALSSKYPKKLKPCAIMINSEDIENDIYKFNLKNYHRWIQNFKIYLVNETLNNILHDHNTNIDLLNNLMGKSLSITFVHSMTDNSLENEPLMFKEIYELINSNNLDFTHKPDDIYRINEETKFKIFFGDMDKLDNLLNMVINRLDNLRILSNKSKSFSKENKIENTNHFSNIYNDNNDYRKMRINLNNPFSNKEKKFNLLSHYKETIARQNQDVEDNLKNLLQLILYRMHLNKILLPIFIKTESRQHSQLI
jgi:hypothetical protein